MSCGQNALDEFPSARLSLARLYPHRALFRLTVREALGQSEGKKRMIFRAYASENLGVWGGPQGALRAQPQNNGNRKFTIFAILLLPNIKSVVVPRYHSLTEHAILHRSCGSFANCVATAFVPTHCAFFRILQSSILTPASAVFLQRYWFDCPKSTPSASCRRCAGLATRKWYLQDSLTPSKRCRRQQFEGVGHDRGSFRFWLPNASPLGQAEWRQRTRFGTVELVKSRYLDSILKANEKVRI